MCIFLSSDTFHLDTRFPHKAVFAPPTRVFCTVGGNLRFLLDMARVPSGKAIRPRVFDA